MRGDRAVKVRIQGDCRLWLLRRVAPPRGMPLRQTPLATWRMQSDLTGIRMCALEPHDDPSRVKKQKYHNQSFVQILYFKMHESSKPKLQTGCKRLVCVPRRLYLIFPFGKIMLIIFIRVCQRSYSYRTSSQETIQKRSL